MEKFIIKFWKDELTDRKNKLSLQLENLDNQPKLQAEKKGQISEGLRISEQERSEIESVINSTDIKIENLRKENLGIENLRKENLGKENLRIEKK